MTFRQNLRNVLGIKATREFLEYLETLKGGGPTPVWSETAPSNPTLNQVWYDTDQTPPRMNVWDGQGWVIPGAIDASAALNASAAVSAAQIATNGMPVVLARPPTDEGDPQNSNVLWFDSANSFKAYVFDYAQGHWHPVTVT